MREKTTHAMRLALAIVPALALTLALTACSDDDNDTPLNDYEQQLVGTWKERTTSQYEVFNYLFNSDHTGTFYVTFYGEVDSSENFTWSATETTLTLSAGRQSESVPYILVDDLLVVDGDITYVRQ